MIEDLPSAVKVDHQTQSRPSIHSSLICSPYEPLVAQMTWSWFSKVLDRS